jgi:N6-adenosine-specific RNA methylase IME4
MSTFDVIVADPAWSYDDKLSRMKSSTKRAADAHYNTMSFEEIASLPIADVASPSGALLGLWVPSAMIGAGLYVMEQWGFTQKQTVIWVKTVKDAKTVAQVDLNRITRVGMGRLFRNSHELAIIGVRGKIQSKIGDRSLRSVIFARNLKHSAKPEEFQNRLERLVPVADRLELFARRQRPGWLCLGDEIDGRDLRDSLPALREAA